MAKGFDWLKRYLRLLGVPMFASNDCCDDDYDPCTNSVLGQCDVIGIPGDPGPAGDSIPGDPGDPGEPGDPGKDAELPPCIDCPCEGDVQGTAKLVCIDGMIQWECCCPEIVDPACSIDDIGYDPNSIVCNPADDSVTFTINPTGTGTALGFIYSMSGVSGNDPVLAGSGSGSFGTPITITTPPGYAGNGNLQINVFDQNLLENCQLSLIVDNVPDSCVEIPCPDTGCVYTAPLLSVECGSICISGSPLCNGAPIDFNYKFEIFEADASGTITNTDPIISVNSSEFNDPNLQACGFYTGTVTAVITPEGLTDGCPITPSVIDIPAADCDSGIAAAFGPLDSSQGQGNQSACLNVSTTGTNFLYVVWNDELIADQLTFNDPDGALDLTGIPNPLVSCPTDPCVYEIPIIGTGNVCLDVDAGTQASTEWTLGAGCCESLSCPIIPTSADIDSIMVNPNGCLCKLQIKWKPGVPIGAEGASKACSQAYFIITGGNAGGDCGSDFVEILQSPNCEDQNVTVTPGAVAGEYTISGLTGTVVSGAINAWYTGNDECKIMSISLFENCSDDLSAGVQFAFTEDEVVSWANGILTIKQLADDRFASSSACPGAGADAQYCCENIAHRYVSTRFTPQAGSAPETYSTVTRLITDRGTVPTIITAGFDIRAVDLLGATCFGSTVNDPNTALIIGKISIQQNAAGDDVCEAGTLIFTDVAGTPTGDIFDYTV